MRRSRRTAKQDVEYHFKFVKTLNPTDLFTNFSLMAARVTL